MSVKKIEINDHNLSLQGERDLNAATTLIIISLLMIVVSLIGSFSQETATNTPTLATKEKTISWMQKISSSLQALDHNLEIHGDAVNEMARNQLSSTAVKKKFNDEMASSIKLIADRVSGLSKEINQLSKESQDIKLELAKLHKQLTQSFQK